MHQLTKGSIWKLVIDASDIKRCSMEIESVYLDMLMLNCCTYGPFNNCTFCICEVYWFTVSGHANITVIEQQEDCTFCICEVYWFTISGHANSTVIEQQEDCTFCICEVYWFTVSGHANITVIEQQEDCTFCICEVCWFTVSGHANSTVIEQQEHCTFCDNVERTYDACPKYSELGSFRII